jgi:UDP-galactopyranose mutase
MRVLIVGAGLYGATCAHELRRRGHNVRVLEKRAHIAGNAFTRHVPEAGAHEHVYGAHIFHTNSDRIWNYINRFARFNHFTNRVKVRRGDSLYSFPINLFTMFQVFGVTTPEEARRALEADRIPCSSPRNMEDYCLATIGRSLYSLFIEGYTTKQWGRHPRDLPADIVKRLPVRLTFDDNYFEDRYQGIPVGGYTAMVESMLEGVELLLETDFLNDRDHWEADQDLVIYTGPIDAYFGYSLGHLAYRSLRFERELLSVTDFQGTAVVNYSDATTPYTRILEHKHFDLNLRAPSTLITREYPKTWSPGDIEYYPLNDGPNSELFRRYAEAAAKLAPRIHFGGRLGQYRYYDMHQVIGAALAYVEVLV